MKDNQKLSGSIEKISSKPIDPIESVLNHIGKVITIIALILLLGEGYVIKKVKPLFSANAVIKVEPVNQKILYGKEEASITSYFDDYVRTQINIVQSFNILFKAIEKHQEQGFFWQLKGESLEQAVERLVERLSITQLSDTHLFSISMFDRNKEGLAELINAVATTYLEVTREEQGNKDYTKLTFLKKRKIETEKILAKRYSILEDISAKYAVGITDEKNIYVYLQAIVDLTQQLVKATNRRIEAESMLKELRAQMEKLKVMDISADIEEWVENDWAIRDNRIQISRKLQDIRLTLAGMKPNHPDHKEFGESLQRLLEVQEDMRSRARKMAENVLRGRLLSDQNTKIMKKETEYAAALSSEEKLRVELTEAERKATEVNSQMMKASTLRGAIKRLHDSLYRIDERIDQIQVESRSAGRISLMTEAKTPERPSSGQRLKMMIVVLVFSLVTGIGYAIGVDKLNGKIRTTRDIERILGFAPTGFVIEASEDKRPASNIYRTILDRPHSLLSEQYKDISFAFSMEREKNGSTTYTYLSTEGSHGATSMLINNLSSMMMAKEKKIMVDLNIWRPISRRLISNVKQGLCEILEGKCDLREAIVTESEYPFHIMPLGDWKNGNMSLIQQSGLKKIIETLRSDYKYIMIDSPPLLLTADAKFIVQLSDVAVLVVKAGEVGENELFKAVSILDKIDIQVISVILNQMKILRSKYYKEKMKKYYNLTKLSKENISTQDKSVSAASMAISKIRKPLFSYYNKVTKKFHS